MLIRSRPTPPRRATYQSIPRESEHQRARHLRCRRQSASDEPCDHTRLRGSRRAGPQPIGELSGAACQPADLLSQSTAARLITLTNARSPPPNQSGTLPNTFSSPVAAYRLGSSRPTHARFRRGTKASPCSTDAWSANLTSRASCRASTASPSSSFNKARSAAVISDRRAAIAVSLARSTADAPQFGHRSFATVVPNRQRGHAVTRQAPLRSSFHPMSLRYVPNERGERREPARPDTLELRVPSTRVPIPASTSPNRLSDPPAQMRRPDLGIIDLQVVGHDGHARGSERLLEFTSKLQSPHRENHKFAPATWLRSLRLRKERGE